MQRVNLHVYVYDCTNIHICLYIAVIIAVIHTYIYSRTNVCLLAQIYMYVCMFVYICTYLILSCETKYVKVKTSNRWTVIISSIKFAENLQPFLMRRITMTWLTTLHPFDLHPPFHTLSLAFWSVTREAWYALLNFILIFSSFLFVLPTVYPIFLVSLGHLGYISWLGQDYGTPSTRG